LAKRQDHKGFENGRRFVKSSGYWILTTRRRVASATLPSARHQRALAARMKPGVAPMKMKKNTTLTRVAQMMKRKFIRAAHEMRKNPRKLVS
jgi:hypothetical protein